MKIVLKMMVFLSLWASLYSAPIEIGSWSDYDVLHCFFRTMFTQSEYGYVLDGSKPISYTNLIPIEDPIAPETPFFPMEVFAHEAIDAWQRIAPEQGNIVLKSKSVFVEESGCETRELMFINLPKLKAEIEANLPLFRYVLGPCVDTQSIVKRILDSKESLDVILRQDNVLIGIVLGFGSYNSLMHSRAEEISYAPFRRDAPPFCGRIESVDDNEIVLLDELRLNLLLLHQNFSRSNYDSALSRGLGFSSFQEELDRITSLQQQIPETLLEEKPYFVFAAYQNESNSSLVTSLQSSQTKIKSLVDKPDFLECVLESISGEKPILPSVLRSGKGSHFPIHGGAEALAQILWNICSRFDKEAKPSFIEAFCSANLTDTKRPKLHMMPGTLAGFKRAKENLERVESQFLALSKKSEIEQIIPGSLYFERMKMGSGAVAHSIDRLLLSYVVEDGCGNVLTAAHNCWVNLSNTIPGFFLGVNGMCEGETRHIYIHPSYGYGIAQSSPCTSLKVKVTLHEINKGSEPISFSPQPHDLSWLKDERLFREVEEASFQIARALGAMWGVWLKKSADIDFVELCKNLKSLAEKQEKADLSKEKAQLCNRIFWNLIQAPRLSQV